MLSWNSACVPTASWHWPAGDSRERAAAGARGLRAREQRHRDAQRREPAASSVRACCSRQQFGGRHERHLPAAAERARGGCRRHRGLAAAHVALHQARHRLRERQVGVDLRQHALLRAGKAKRQALSKPRLQLRGVSEPIGAVGLGRAAQAPSARAGGRAVPRMPAGAAPDARPAASVASWRADRRLVHELQRRAQLGQMQSRAQRRRQAIGQRRRDSVRAARGAPELRSRPCVRPSVLG